MIEWCYFQLDQFQDSGHEIESYRLISEGTVAYIYGTNRQEIRE